MELSVRRLFLPGGTQSAGPYELRLPIFLQPLGGVLKNRSAAPASPPCFRRRRWSAPLLFESTRLCESDICAKENRQCISTPAVFSWARVDYASRAAKNSPLGCFCPFFCDGAAAVRIHPPSLREGYYKTETPVPGSDTGVLGGRGWIRTTEAEKQQIYSLSPLATREHAHILFVSVAGRLA